MKLNSWACSRPGELTDGLPEYPISFGAGVVSFLSPCVLPLVPGYLSYMSGISAAEDTSARRAFKTGSVAVAFVLGFTLVFVAQVRPQQIGAFLRNNETTMTGCPV